MHVTKQTYMALINAYAGCGHIEKAKQVTYYSITCGLNWSSANIESVLIHLGNEPFFKQFRIQISQIKFIVVFIFYCSL